MKILENYTVKTETGPIYLSREVYEDLVALRRKHRLRLMKHRRPHNDYLANRSTGV